MCLCISMEGSGWEAELGTLSLLGRCRNHMTFSLRSYCPIFWGTCWLNIDHWVPKMEANFMYGVCTPFASILSIESVRLGTCGFFFFFFLTRQSTFTAIISTASHAPGWNRLGQPLPFPGHWLETPAHNEVNYPKSRSWWERAGTRILVSWFSGRSPCYGMNYIFPPPTTPIHMLKP